MATTKKVSLDVWGHSNEQAIVTRGEVKSRNLEIALIDIGGAPYELDGYTARIYVIPPYGDPIFLDASISQGKVIAEIPCLNTAGKCQAQIVLTNEAGEELRVTGLTIHVQPSSLETAEDVSSTISVVAILSDAEAATEAANQAAATANIAAASASRIDNTVNNELYGEALHL